MFRFADKDVVFWPVELRQTGEDGQVVEVTVHLAYRLLPRKQLREREKRGLMSAAAHLQKLDGPRSAEDLAAAFDATVERETGDVELLLDHVADWRGFADGEEPLAFSRERLAALLEFDVYFKPIMAGLHEASRSGPAKNSLPGPGGSPVPAQA